MFIRNICVLHNNKCLLPCLVSDICVWLVSFMESHVNAPSRTSYNNHDNNDLYNARSIHNKGNDLVFQGPEGARSNHRDRQDLVVLPATLITFIQPSRVETTTSSPQVQYLSPALKNLCLTLVRRCLQKTNWRTIKCPNMINDYGFSLYLQPNTR